MTNVSAVEKMAELMQQIEVNSPRVAALHYCLSETARHIAELEQKLAESQREFRAADATIENLQMQLNAEREAKLALAAENTSLKGALNKIAFTYSLSPHIHEMTTIATPDTDSFLAEVRASAVDEACLKISSAIVNCYQDEQVGIDAAATICGDFAAQLRKGVQS